MPLYLQLVFVLTNLNPADFFKNDIELELTHHSGKISYSLLEMKVVTSMMMRCLNVLVSAYLIDSYLELLSNLFFFFFFGIVLIE